MRSKRATPAAAGLAPAELTAAAVPVIDPHAVYFTDTFQRLFRLRKSTIRREWRSGRLRLAKRCGRYYVLGEWVLQWLREGEVRPEAQACIAGSVRPGGTAAQARQCASQQS